MRHAETGRGDAGWWWDLCSQQLSDVLKVVVCRRIQSYVLVCLYDSVYHTESLAILRHLVRWKRVSRKMNHESWSRLRRGSLAHRTA